MPRSFRLVRTLGRGAHGAVHLAEMRDEDDYVQTLAVKRLLPEWSGDPDLVARLKDEARLLALLHHDHVVRVHGLTRIEGGLAILMEPVDGIDLGRLVARHGAVEARVALEIVRAVADALDAAWNTTPDGRAPLRVVHRDIKPSNVMLTARGGVKVMDFGVARATFASREGETRSQQFGTARYMAPERWLHGEAEHRSDVFSLGITLIEIAGGGASGRFRLAPDGFADDLAQATSALGWEPLRELARRMAAFAPEDRPTAAEVVAACDALLVEAPGAPLRVWAPAVVVPAVGEPVDPTQTATLLDEESASRSAEASRATLAPRRRWWIAVPAIWLAAAVVAGLSWSPAQTSTPPDPPGPVPTPAPPAPVAILGTPPAPAEVTRLPDPRPQPEPVAPAPSRPRPLAAPAPEPAPEAAPTPTSTVHLSLDPGLVVLVDGRRVAQRQSIVQLPTNQSVALEVVDGEARSTCWVTFSASVGKVRVEKGGKCSVQ